MIADGMSSNGKPTDAESRDQRPPAAQRAIGAAVSRAVNGTLHPAHPEVPLEVPPEVPAKVSASPTPAAAKPAPTGPAPATASITQPAAASKDLPARADGWAGQSPTDPAALAATMLPADQIIALYGLLERKPLAEIARLANVSDRTIRRWVRTDVKFIAVLNAFKLDSLQSLRLRRHLLGRGAMDNVEEAIDAGDLKASFKVLDSIGVFDPDPPAPVTPEAVEQQLKIEQADVHQEIDRSRERAWKKHLNTRKARKKRYDEVSPTYYGERDKPINGLKAMDLPEQAKPDERAPRI